MKRFGLLVSLLCGCSSGATRPSNVPAHSVEAWGSLREMVHEGRTESRVAIASVVAKPHVYALGALEGMRGEITILDGTAWLAVGTSDEGRAHNTVTDEGAALLVASSVVAWKKLVIDTDIAFAELDQRIETMAASAGIDVEKPFPFLLEGTLLDVHWHVLRGPPTPGSSPHDHAKNAVVGEMAELLGTAVGFFSKHHQGVFTHMGQRTHAHIIDARRAIAGHADRLSVRAGSTVAFPAPGVR